MKKFYHLEVTCSQIVGFLMSYFSSDVGGPVAAEGATYAAPGNIPYKFTMNANVRGYHKVLAVTSNSDKLKLERIEYNTVKVSSVNFDIFARI